MERNQKELAAYLARARGPGETSMKFTPRPRPTGEAARAVWKIYDLPLNPDAGIGTKYNDNDGTDWSLGNPSKLGELPHDGGMGLDGNLYYTVNNPNTPRHDRQGRRKDRRGLVPEGRCGERRSGDQLTGWRATRKGNFWFDVNPGRRSLGKLDTATQKITVYETPSTMSPVGGAVTMDVDGKGMIWASAPDGAVRFDPATEKFTGYKSLTSKSAKGTIATYGAAGDRDGNGWWAQMAMDTIGRANVATGEVTEVKLPPVKSEMRLRQGGGLRVLRELRRR